MDLARRSNESAPLEMVSIAAHDQTDSQLLGALSEVQAELAERGYDVGPGMLGALSVGEAMAEEAQTARGRTEWFESASRQFPVAADAHDMVAAWLNPGRTADTQIAPLDRTALGDTLRTWLTPDKLTYMVRQGQADPDLRYTLVATPNVPVGPKEIHALANALSDGDKEPYPGDNNFFLARYSPEELAGNKPDNGQPVTFSLVPNNVQPMKGRDGKSEQDGSFSEQKKALFNLQTEHPFLVSPSVLQALCYLATLRRDGLELGRTTAPQRLTSIVSCHMQSHLWGGAASVPQTSMYAAGKWFYKPGNDLAVGLHRSEVGQKYSTRFAIG